MVKYLVDKFVYDKNIDVIDDDKSYLRTFNSYQEAKDYIRTAMVIYKNKIEDDPDKELYILSGGNYRSNDDYGTILIRIPNKLLVDVLDEYIVVFSIRELEL